MDYVADNPDAQKIYRAVWGTAHCPSELSLILDVPLGTVEQLVQSMVEEGILERVDEKLPDSMKYREKQKPVRVAISSPREYINLLAD